MSSPEVATLASGAARPPAQLLDGHHLARNGLISLLGQVLPGVAGIVFLPYLVHQLGAERFGMLSLIWLAIGYFSIFDFGLGRAVTKSVAEDLGRGDRAAAGATARVGLGLLVWLGLAAGLVCAVAAEPLVERFFRLTPAAQGEAVSAVRWMSVALPLVVFTTGVRGILEGAQQFGVVNVVRIPTGILLFAAPAAVIHFGYGLTAIVATTIVIRALGLAVYLLAARRAVPLTRLPRAEARARARELARFGSWVALSLLVSPLMVSADRVLIGAIISVSAVTWYATPFEVVSKLLIIPGAISVVLFPAYAAAVHERLRLERLYSAGFWIVVCLLLPAVATCTLLAPELLRAWLGEEFVVRSAQVAVWLTIGILVNGAAQVPFALLQGLGRSDVTGIIHVVETPVYGLLLWGGLYWFGVTGAAAAWALRALLDLVLLTVASARLGQVRPERPHPAFVVASACVLAALFPLSFVVRAGLLVVALAASALLLIRSAAGLDLGLLRRAGRAA